MKQRVVILMVLVSCLIPTRVSPQASTNYQLVGGNINSGGSVHMSSTNYAASITLGQSGPIGVSNSASYQAQMGVQYIYHVPLAQNSYLLWTK